MKNFRRMKISESQDLIPGVTCRPNFFYDKGAEAEEKTPANS